MPMSFACKSKLPTACASAAGRTSEFKTNKTLTGAEVVVSSATEARYKTGAMLMRVARCGSEGVCGCELVVDYQPVRSVRLDDEGRE